MNFKFALLGSAAAVALAGFAAKAETMEELTAAAKKEGELTIIAVPHDWCGYGAMIDAFKAKTGLKMNELNPDGSSGDEIEAIKANKTNKGPQAPDIVDVGLSFGPNGKAEGLFQPYKVSTWASIPDSQKDADGFWTGDYYGVMAFVVNKDIVKNTPTDWADLLKPEYKNSVALSGDPRTAAQSINAVFAAGLSAANGDVEKAPAEGLKFFDQLNKAGNFVPVSGKAATLAQGATPIAIKWDYNALADRDSLKGNPPVEVVVPKTGVLAGVYVQAISAYAPHPNAAKLWMEYMYSDEGQIAWLKGYCHPVRFLDLQKNNKVPADVLKALPDAANYAKALFPTLDQQKALSETITKGWDSAVGAAVK